VTSIEGYRVETNEGKTVGHVARESELALVVESGSWPRKRWRALPKQFADVDRERGSVVMTVSKTTLAASPELKRDMPVDEDAVASWWALD